MECHTCQRPNPVGAKFCMNCGASLALVCPSCQTENPAGARFCFNCGFQLTAAAPVAAPPPAEPPQARLQSYVPKELLSKLEGARASGGMQGERRIVTMLFCDMKGSTALASQLDPEDWHTIMNGAFEHLIRPVYRYEGTVARLMGDAILAFFGAPISHEDDPQRAILAGLDIIKEIQPYRAQIQQQWGFDLNVRVGINTGLVVVGEVGSDLRMEYTAMGDAINLAARMEQTAQPGTVQIAHDTYKLVAPLFDIETLGGLNIKGKTEPVPAYRVLRAKPRPGRLRGISGLDSPLVGREQEMQRLRDAVTQLLAGHGQIISIIGEAGLGKSRLVAEMRRALAALIGDGSHAGEILWFEGRSLSYETTTPFAALSHLLRGAFALPGADSDLVYADLQARLAALAPATAPFIATLLGIQPSDEDDERVKYLEPPVLRHAILQAVHTLVRTWARTRPLVLVFDDIHWIDPTSLDLLEQLLPLTAEAPLLIIALYRPRQQELAGHFRETAQQRFAERHQVVALEPLSDDCARQLVSNLLYIENLPEKVRQLILRKAEGNPFFVEEVIRSLLEAGLVVYEDEAWRATRDIAHITVPDTLAGVIGARLDRLDEPTRRVAQEAAVIGREFSAETLAGIHDSRAADRDGAQAALDMALSNLLRLELIREKGHTPQRVFVFKHGLTQETAYGTLLLSRRRELHAQVGDYLERTQSERVEELARHFQEARQWARALPYLVSAGERAARAYATQEAIGYFQQALDTPAAVKPAGLERRAFEGLGNALTFANDVLRAADTYQAMLAYARRQDDIPTQVSALTRLASTYAMHMGQFQQALDYLNEGDRLARTYQDKDGISELNLVHCMMCTIAADFAGVVHYMDETVVLSEELGATDRMVAALAHMSNSQMLMTHFEQGWQTAQRGLRLAVESGRRDHEADLLTRTIALYHLRNGDLEAAHAAAAAGAAIGQRIGELHGRVYGPWMLGQVAWLRGDYDAALDYHQQAVDAALPTAAYMPFLAVQPLGSLGSVFLEISPHYLDRALDCHGQALRMLEHPAGVIAGGTAWADLGFCVLAQGQLALAGELFHKGLNYPTMFMHLERPRFLVGLTTLALRQEQLDEAERLVAEACAYAEERQMRHLYPLLALTRGQTAAARGRGEEALAAFSQAEALAREMGMRPQVWQAQAAAASLLTQQGRQAEALAQRQSARRLIGEIADGITDATRRAYYLDHALTQL